MRWPRLVLALPLFLMACTAPSDEVPTAVVAEPGVSFSAVPVVPSPCDTSAPFPVRVSWEMVDVDDPKFDIRLHSSQGQLWARENMAKGQRDTDAWGRAGMWFVLLDRNTQRVLATTQVPPLVCP